MAADDETPEVAEIEEEKTMEGKLDLIIRLLEQNLVEHQDIRDRLSAIETNQDLQKAALQQQGLLIGELIARGNS